MPQDHTSSTRNEKSSPTVSIVIPTYNGQEFLGPCIQSVLDQTHAPDEIIIVDDASPEPGDAAFIQETFGNEDRIRVIRNESNLGFAGSANRGLKEAHGEFLALINNDTVLTPTWLQRALEPFSSPEVGSVATRLDCFKPDGRIDSAGDLYTTAGGTEKFKHGYPDWEAGPTRQTFSACAAAAVYRREALVEVDLNPTGTEITQAFEPGFGSYYEDVDLGFRLNCAGWKCIFTPEAIVRHHVSGSYGKRSWTLTFRSSRNAETVFWTNMPTALLLRYGLEHFLFLGFQGLAKLRQGTLLPWICGKVAFLLSSPKALSRRKILQARRKLSAPEVQERLWSKWFSLHLGAKRT